MAQQSISSYRAYQELTTNDLAVILNVLSQVESKCLALGIQLGVEPDQINTIERENRDCCNDQLRKVIFTRLKQETPLTWQSIITALRAKSVRESKLATQIESQLIDSSKSLALQHRSAETSCNPPHTPLSATLANLPSSEPLPCTLDQTSLSTHQPSTGPQLPHQSQHIPMQGTSNLDHSSVSHSSFPYHPSQYLPPSLQFQPYHTPTFRYQQQHLSSVEQYSQASDSNGLQYINSIVDYTEPLYKQFIDFVKTRYRLHQVERDPKVLKWPSTPSKVYINLAFIDRKTRGLRTMYDEITEAMVRDGNVDVINETKLPIDMDQIAAVMLDSNSERVILVEGAPGVGKSTFALEFCRRWERRELAQQYHLVLLLRLRDDRISRAEDLKDLIQHHSKDVCSAVNTMLECTTGANSLIILEGFDELPEKSRSSSSSVFLRLIYGEMLPLATVMVTSRPWATRILREDCSHSIFQHIEILGFTKQQISEYIVSSLTKGDAKNLESYLERHSQIRQCMYIPLNSAIVVTVYEESQESHDNLPTTLTELYVSLTQILVLRHLKGHPEYEKGTKSISCFQGLLVPLNVHANFSALCKLAYDGVVGAGDQVQLIFKDLAPDFDNLGFMDSVTELYATQGTLSSHNFLHLTFQEYFAAVHISNMSLPEQMNHFVKHKTNGRMRVVLRFVAGLKKLNCFSEDTICQVIEPFHIEMTTQCGNLLYNSTCVLDSVVMNWMYEAQSDDILAKFLGQKKIVFRMHSRMLPMDYYSLGYSISHSLCMWALLMSKDEISSDNAAMLEEGATGNGPMGLGRIVGLGVLENIFEHTCTPYPVSCECLKEVFTKWKPILCLNHLSLRLSMPCDMIAWPDLAQLRVLVLSFENIFKKFRLDTLLPLLSLESLIVDCTGMITEDYTAIADFVASSANLKELHLSSGLNHGVECITKALASNDSQALKILEMQFNAFTSAAVNNMVQMLSKNTLHFFSVRGEISTDGLLLLVKALQHHKSTMIKNHLTFSVYGDSDACSFAKLLIEYPAVIDEYSPAIRGITDAGVITLSKAISFNTSLTCLDLSYCRMSNDGAQALAQALVHNHTIRKLVLSNGGIDDAVAAAIAKGLYQSSLEELKNTICDGGTMALAEAIHENSTLRWLDMSNNFISDQGAKNLAYIFQHSSHSTLEYVSLQNDHISDAGVVALAQALHHNLTLQGLNLSNNSIRDVGAQALAKVLCNNSTLEALNLSNNSISDYGARPLAQALCYNSTLRELELSINSITYAEAEALAQAFCHSSRSILKELDLSYNHISDVGVYVVDEVVYQNSTLEVLKLSNNSITDAGAEALAQAFCHSSILRELDLSSNRISDIGVVALAKAFHQNSTLECLKLSNNGITDAGAKALAQAFCHSSILRELDLSSNHISDNGAAQAFCHSSRSILKELDLSYNHISDVGVYVVAEAFLQNSTLECLKLSNNSINNAGAEALARAFCHSSILRELDLSYNRISDNGVAALAGAFHQNSTLECLKLSNNSINDAGAVDLARAFCHSSVLRELDLSYNRISDNGVAALAEAFHQNSTLEVLKLSNNSITDAGAVDLAQAFCRSFILRELDLSSNHISDYGIAVLANAFYQNSTLEVLKLSNNSINDRGAEALAQAFCRSSILRELDLSSNHISDNGVVALAKAFHQNSTLECLKLSNNSITDAGAEALAQAFCNSSILRELDLSYNHISFNEVVALAEAFHHNSTLEVQCSSCL